MKRTKLLFSVIVSLLLACIMTFSLAACNSGKDAPKPDITPKPDVTDKSADELGITDNSEEDWALLYIEIVTNGRAQFNLGEEFTSTGLSVRAVYLNPDKKATIEDIEGNLERVSLNANQYEVDSSDFNPNRVGSYTIYVSYTFEGVTCIATYTVRVRTVNPEVGGIRAQLADGKDDSITLSSTAQSATVTKDIVSVYQMELNAEGKVVPADEPLDPDEYEVQLYLGSKLIENNEVTENGVYSLVAYLVDDPNNQDFISVYVVNPVEKIELDQSAGGVFEQGQSMKDNMTSTWRFTVTYANGVTKTVKGGDAGLTISLNTNTLGENQTANVTYSEKDGKGGNHTVTCTVTYTITEFKGDPVNYFVTYDADPPEGSTPVWVTTWENDEEDFDGAVTVDLSALKTARADSKTTEDGWLSVENSYEFKASNNLIITVSEAAQNVVIKYYVSHASAGISDRTASVTKDGETVAEVTPQAPDESTSPYLEVITVNATAGTYVLTANNTMRLYKLEISYTAIPGSVPQDETLKYRPEVGTVYAGGVLLENDVFRASISENSEVPSFAIEKSEKETNTDGIKMPNRLKFGGSIDIANNEDVNNESANMVKNAIKIEASTACTLTFYVRSSSGTEPRLFQGYTFDEASGKLFPLTAGLENNVNTKGDGLVYVLTFEIEAGTFYFGSASSGVGIYGLDVAFS